jgi:hypothetical protein
MGHNTHVRYINRFTSETKLLVDARLGADIRAWARQRLGHPAHWFFRRVTLRRLRPVCVIRYARTARMAETPEGPVRMTLDASVMASPTTVVTLTAVPSRPLVEGLMILELKYSGLFPRIFKDLVDEFHLTPRPASKYRFAVQTLGLAGSGTAMLQT